MKFYESIEKLLNNEDYNSYGLACGLSVDDVISLIEALRVEYAPTVEMTKKQYHSFKLWKYHTAGWNMTNCAEWARDEHIKTRDAMQAWLHPETIKIKG